MKSTQSLWVHFGDHHPVNSDRSKVKWTSIPPEISDIIPNSIPPIGRD